MTMHDAADSIKEIRSFYFIKHKMSGKINRLKAFQDESGIYSSILNMEHACDLIDDMYGWIKGKAEKGDWKLEDRKLLSRVSYMVENQTANWRTAVTTILSRHLDTPAKDLYEVRNILKVRAQQMTSDVIGQEKIKHEIEKDR